MASIRQAISQLQEQCDQRRALLLSRRLQTPAELAKWWPGGEANTAKTLWAWVRCFDQYGSWLDRKHPDVIAQEKAAKQRAILEALADEPETVTLATRNEDGSHRVVSVYPKSAYALTQFEKWNTELARTTDQAELVAAEGRIEDVDVLLGAHAECLYWQSILCWIATTPGVGVPYAEGELTPPLPDEWQALNPADYYAIAQAFQRVNTIRLMALDATRHGETRPDFSVFLSSLAGSLNRSTPEIWHDMSLASALAAAAERARAYQQSAALAAKKPTGPLSQFARAS